MKWSSYEVESYFSEKTEALMQKCAALDWTKSALHYDWNTVKLRSVKIRNDTKSDTAYQCIGQILNHQKTPDTPCSSYLDIFTCTTSRMEHF